MLVVVGRVGEIQKHPVGISWVKVPRSLDVGCLVSLDDAGSGRGQCILNVGGFRIHDVDVEHVPTGSETLKQPVRTAIRVVRLDKLEIRSVGERVDGVVDASAGNVDAFGWVRLENLRYPIERGVEVVDQHRRLCDVLDLQSLGRHGLSG